MKSLKTLVLVLGFGGVLTSFGHSAVITFTTGTFDDDSVLSLAGPSNSEVYGAAFVGNGDTFMEDGYKLTDYTSSKASFSVAGPVNGVTHFGGFLVNGTTEDSTGDSTLDETLTNGVYGGGGDILVTLDGLNIGQKYTVLNLVADTRSDVSGRKAYTSNGTPTGESAEITYAFGNGETAGGTPTIGAYYLGTFTADAHTQTLEVNGDGAQYQTIIVTTPEPGTCALLLSGLGLLAFVARCRWARA